MALCSEEVAGGVMKLTGKHRGRKRDKTFHNKLGGDNWTSQSIELEPTTAQVRQVSQNALEPYSELRDSPGGPHVPRL